MVSLPGVARPRQARRPAQNLLERGHDPRPGGWQETDAEHRTAGDLGNPTHVAKSQEQHGERAGGVVVLDGTGGSPSSPPPSWLLPPPPAGQPRLGAPSTHLSTDSTNTLSALMWIQAMKASLKFTLSQRSSGPCGDRTAGDAWGSGAGRQAKGDTGPGRAKPRAERRPAASRSSESVGPGPRSRGTGCPASSAGRHLAHAWGHQRPGCGGPAAADGLPPTPGHQGAHL